MSLFSLRNIYECSINYRYNVMSNGIKPDLMIWIGGFLIALGVFPWIHFALEYFHPWGGGLTYQWAMGYFHWPLVTIALIIVGAILLGVGLALKKSASGTAIERR